MSSSLSPASAAVAPSLLDRARALMQQGRLAAAPLAAAAAIVNLSAPAAEAQLSVDYAAATTQSNSGWLTGLFIDETGAGGSTAGNSASLSGNRSIQDDLFWYYSDYYEKTVPRADTTGIAFIWGGALSPTPARDGESLTANASFTIDFTFTPSAAYPSDTPYINYEFLLGYGSSPYAIDYDNIQTPHYSADNYTNTYGGFDGDPLTSPLTLQQALTLDFNEGTNITYWFAQLNLNWNNEYANSYSWDDDYAKLNGDTFTALGTVALDYHAVSAVPEPASSALASGLLAGLALWWRRRSLRRC